MTICYNCPKRRPQPCMCPDKQAENEQKAAINAMKQKDCIYRDYLFDGIAKTQRRMA